MIPLILVASKLSTFWLAAAKLGDPCTLPKHNFFFLPPWWEFLQPRYDELGHCAVTLNNAAGKFQLNSVWAIGLAVLDMLLRIGGFAAVISIIIAGVQYITSTGNTENATNARKRLTNSLIGLAIVLVAGGVVAFIGNTFGG
jgi:hypothetical protein